MSVSLLQLENGFLPMSVTRSGSMMLCRELHKAKACSPMDVRESGNVMLLSELQPMKAFPPMNVRELPRVMLDKDSQ